MNKFLFSGRLVRDVELRQSSDKIIANFTVAVPRRYNKNAENQESDFISCVAFGKTAEFLQKFGKKGVAFEIESHVQTGSYTKQDGSKVYTTTAVVENIEFKESKRNDSGTHNESVPTANSSADAPLADVNLDEYGFSQLPDEGLPFC